MEDKPVTDLDLLPPLEIVSLESLPGWNGAQIATLERQRSDMLVNSVGSAAIATTAGTGAFLFLCLYILGLFSLPYDFVGTLIAGFATVIFGAGFGIMWEKHARYVREYRQLTTPPQLQLGAGTESRYFDMAKLTNEMSVDLNITMENEMRKDPSERNLKELQRKYALLSDNIEEIKAWANGGLKPKTD